MKRRIRLTESSLHRIIKESVRRILRENEARNEEQDWWWHWGFRQGCSGISEEQFQRETDDMLATNGLTQDNYDFASEGFKEALNGHWDYAS